MGMSHQNKGGLPALSSGQEQTTRKLFTGETRWPAACQPEEPRQNADAGVEEVGLLLFVIRWERGLVQHILITDPHCCFSLNIRGRQRLCSFIPSVITLSSPIANTKSFSGSNFNFQAAVQGSSPAISQISQRNSYMLWPTFSLPGGIYLLNPSTTVAALPLQPANLLTVCPSGTAGGTQHLIYGDTYRMQNRNPWANS